MKGDRSLNERPFRYGGILHDFDAITDSFNATTDDWADAYGKNYERCYICGGSMRNPAPNLRKKYPYAAFFKITKGRKKGNFHIKVMCRQCAYAFGRGVVEMDGHVYMEPDEFSESKYKKKLQEEGIEDGD